MNTFKTSTIIVGFVGLAGILLAPAAISAPGKGWDTFNMGQGDPIPVASKDYVGTSSGASATKGWDTFNMKQGDPIPAASQGALSAPSGAPSTGGGWDVFYTGEGDKL
ncbi:MAG: hypothetical protein ROZ09_13995 [Thiobacillus sp.]|jgi:hypothetical protein|uniref:hypothetical protein n=1 Tax=Thiobacillus sp. TaxID=924 RepID=UPI00289384B3|nr:hypothetical protein [Thiobacillus sp.]MDT3707931.1 hypothetical protein [Thiobacillus sp.]